MMRDVVDLALCALDAKVVADLAGAEEEAHGVRDGGVGKDGLEFFDGEVGDRARRIGVAEHRLRREDDQGLAPFAHRLAAQEVEVLCGGGGLRDLHVLLRGELEVALDAGGGVLRPLAFVAVRQKKDDAGEQAPLGFAGGEELVDDDLRAVGEVAELRLPEDERLGIVAGVAVLVAEDGGLRQYGVVDLPAALIGRDVRERRPADFGLGVDEDGVALVEGAALRVLTGEAYGRAGLEERGIGEEFGEAVVDGALAVAHLDALLEELRDLGMDVETFGRSRELLRERGYLGGVKAGDGVVAR